MLMHLACHPVTPIHCTQTPRLQKGWISMSKNVFRRSFLKGAALGLSAIAVGVPVLAEEKGIYLPGT